MKILPVVVIYNEDFLRSNVYLSLLKYYPNIEVVLYENSTRPINSKYSNRVIYFYDENNGGVSAGYNYASMIAKDRSDIEALLLLDQDTIFSSDYISRLEEELDRNNLDIFVPQVLFDGDKPFSPVSYSGFSCRPVSIGSGVYKLSQYIPINSGSCVRLNRFLEINGYNTQIKLDFADFDFFTRLSRVSNYFCVVDSIAKQNFSNNESNYLKLKNRFVQYIQSGNSAKQNVLIKRMVTFSMIRHTIALTIRTKRPFFLWYYIKNFRL